VKAYSYPFYPATKTTILKQKHLPAPTLAAVGRGLLPTAVALCIAEVIANFTSSGYSVMIMMLLCVMLYTTYRYGTRTGIICAAVMILYNIYAVSMTIEAPIFSAETIESSIVVTIVFPILAFMFGRLKSRNDMLLQREQAARMNAEESAQQLNFMAETLPQKIFTTLPNGKSVYMNSQWSTFTGMSKRTMTKWDNVVHPQDHKKNMNLWQKSLKTGEPLQIEHRLKRSDGVYVWHLTRVEPLRDKKGTITLWIGSSTDIEDVRRARKLEADTLRLKKQRQELVELNKAKDEFISIASHQLRTPATGVKQYVNMALEGYAGELTPKLREFLETANDSNERQLSIINDLLKVAQIDAGKVVLQKKRVAVDAMIASIMNDCKQTLETRHQKIEFDHKQRIVTLQADPTKLRMVLENIIDNASKYSFENTLISITASKYRGNVRISVRDQGVGIDKNDTQKVFEKFGRVDNPLSTKVGGNGLGLYWVRKIIELHGGTITVTPHASSGTTFTITLPAE
jgi:PAS domain S-box-containing protein